jgi:protocatechuate 3,4-dioxygenase beta subunit
MEPDHEHSLDVSPHMNRRNVLRLLAGAGVVTLVSCSSSSRSASNASSTTATSGSTSTSGSGSTTTGPTSSGTVDASSPIPEETGGPFPADGTNGPNVLTEDGVVRRDITSSFGSGSGTAEGVPARVELTLLDTGNGAAALAGAAVYLWHCDREGRYSLYSDGASDANYLRGVQVSDGAGLVAFETIFPACYSGRWPHIHFEVYSSVDDATGGGDPIATSQVALPAATCNEVFATGGYDDSVPNLAQTSLESDMVFSDDGGVRELATVTGNTTDGYTIALTVPV